MGWNLYQEGELLEPLSFSNGKTQEDVVKEVISEVKKGERVIFIKGVCGTGKSAIALNIARELGKTSIVVPGKTLQNQYKKDYENKKYLLKDNEERVKISVITGRNNHPCKFLEQNREFAKAKRETNVSLNDIFSGKRREKESEEKENADNPDIPCKIEIKERNLNKIKRYLKENPKTDPKYFNKASDVKRVSVASTCPYWSPCLPEKYDLGKVIGEHQKRSYMGLDGMKFIYYKRKAGCSFYSQFDDYIDSDVIVFNSLKYKLETAINRKPETELEVVDECDEFLDSFSNQSSINLDKLQNSLAYIVTEDENVHKVVLEVNNIIKEIRNDKKLEATLMTNSIIPIVNTKINELAKIFLKNKDLFEEVDDESYVFDVIETFNMFKEFLDETFLIFNRRDSNFSVNLVTTNLAKRFGEIIDKNKTIVLMSGTLHSEDVLREVFGMENFKVIDAEVGKQGQIEVVKTGKEEDCKYENFAKGKLTREKYLKALNECVKMAKKPALVHVNAFNDLPSEYEKERFELNELLSGERLIEIQNEDKEGRQINLFKDGEIRVLFSTKCSRGVDFPGNQCNSIIFTKYPNPHVQDPFWKILRQNKPTQYWKFYKDKAKRELWQKVYRGLRFKEDHVQVLSPDLRVLDAFEKLNGG